MKRDEQTVNTALAAFAKNDFPKAEQLCRAILKKQPKNADVLNLLAVSLRALNRSAEGIPLLEKAIGIRKVAEYYANLGVCYLDIGKAQEAVDAFTRSLELNDASAVTWMNLGVNRQALGDVAGGEAALREALKRDPNLAQAYVILAQLANGRGDVVQAKALVEKALALRPDLYAALELLGVLLYETDPPAAEAALRKALAVAPNSSDAHFCLAMTLERQARYDDALVEFKRTLDINPGHLIAQVMTVRQKHRICDWSDFDEANAKLREYVAAGYTVNPFIFLTIDSTAEEQLACTRSWVRDKLPSRVGVLPAPVTRRRDKIRVGYLSSDLMQHATAFLMVELWERHDRSRFEIIAYSYGRDDKSAMRQRLVGAFDRFVDVGDMSFEGAARRIREDEVDILIDLKGYTGGARTQIMAYRPAPVQMNFIGYPGTMGADFIDYIIADPFIIPPSHDAFYAEKVIRLPDSYQPNDTKREISSRAVTRAENGLPDDAFVFCSFNSSYKITPHVFDIWMRLLKAVPGSVLWLLQWNTYARDALKREAQARGVDPDRLIFALPMRLDEHLARHRLADVFLDNLPVNAHTTTSDALWAGLPVLTCAGGTFAGRVAGSLVHAVGLPELVTNDLAEYEAMALRLATEPGLAASFKERLARNRLSSPLFDIERFTRHLERGLEQAWERQLAGLPPASFDVEPIGAAATAAPPPAASPPAAPPPAAPPPAAPPPAAPPPAAPVSAPLGRVAYEACPLCDHADIPLVLQVECDKHPAYRPVVAPVMGWRQCGGCGHIFAEGYPTPEVEVALLEAQEDRQVGYNLELQRVLAARTVARVARLKPQGRWLDAECGSAALLFTAQEWGYQVCGMDRVGGNVQMLNRLGYEVGQGGLDRMPGQGVADVLSLMGVLEHSADPRAVLGAAQRLLAPDGLLVVSSANADAMVWRILKVTGGNPYFAEPSRCHMLGRSALLALLRSFGFQMVEFDVSERCRVGIEIIARRG